MLVTPNMVFKGHDNRVGSGTSQSELPLPVAGAASQTCPALGGFGSSWREGRWRSHMEGLTQQVPAIELLKCFPRGGCTGAPVTLGLGHPWDPGTVILLGL